MIEITLSTPLSRIVMPDKLRSRLNILKCRTFRDAMEADPDKWENVSPKVVNAMKRFKKDYNDIYVNLFDAHGNPITVSTSSANCKPLVQDSSIAMKNTYASGSDRRFFVANNLLNAYVASGQMPTEKEDIDVMMAKIMREADAFIRAYDMPNISEPKINETQSVAEASGEPVVSKPRRGRKPKSEREKKGDRKTSTSDLEIRISPRTGKPMRQYNRKPANARSKSKAKSKAAPVDVEIIKPGDVITITEYHGIKEPVYKKFRPGDKVTVTEVKVKRTGRIEAEGVMGEKVASFASDRYRWVVVHDDSTNVTEPAK